MEYVTMMKNLVQSGQQYISAMAEGAPAKASLVRIDRETVVRAVRGFDGSQPDIPRAVRTLSELIYLFNQSNKFNEEQAIQIFFSITKLLQSEEAPLRRMVYLIVKEMQKQNSIYVVTSSLLKDIHHKNAHFRRNSLRVIPMVIDDTNLVQVERYVKGLIADADAGVASAALLAGLQMWHRSADVVRKWGSEISDRLTSKDAYVQYHALMLFGDVKQRDANALRKFLLANSKFEGIAAVQHLRMLRDYIGDIDYDSAEMGGLAWFILRQVRSKDQIVMIQAAKVACDCPFLSNKEMLEVVKVLEPYLSEESTVKKYAVLKIFNRLLQNESRKSLIVNVKEIEKVVKSKNTSLSSIAASILLRICSEEYLQPLLTGLSQSMEEMSGEYKVGVVRSLRSIAKSYPRKHSLINRFVLKQMHMEGSMEIKCEIIALFNYQIVELGGQARAECLRLLTTLIAANSDCRLHFQIMGIISREANEQDVTSGLLRNIITNLFLTRGSLRACSLSTVVKLAEHEHRRRGPLERTIRQFARDRDQEVRDRLAFREMKKPISEYQLDLIENYLHYKEKEVVGSAERSLLSLETIQKWGAEVGVSKIKHIHQLNAPKQDVEEEVKYRDVFASHPTFKSYGTLRKVNKAITLGDADSDLIASLRVFLFDANIVCQFKIENRIKNAVLENVRVDLKHSGTVFKIMHMTSVKEIGYGESGECYLGLQKNEECEEYFAEEKMSAIAKYIVREMAGEVVKTTYEDEYSFEEFEIKLATYMAAWQMDGAEFEKAWGELREKDIEETFTLKYASTQAAEQELTKHFGVRPIECADKSSKGNVITVCMAAKYLGLHPVLITLLLAFDLKRGCLLKIKIKATDEELAQELIETLS